MIVFTTVLGMVIGFILWAKIAAEHKVSPDEIHSKPNILWPPHGTAFTSEFTDEETSSPDETRDEIKGTIHS